MIDDPVELGRDLAVRPLGGRALGFLHDRLVEAGRRGLLTRYIDVAKVESEQTVPDLVHPRIMRPAEPPEPVAAFRDQHFAARGRKIGRGISLTLALAQEVASLSQEFPGHVVLLVPNPGVEVGVDPGSRMNAGQRSVRWKLRQEFRHGHGLYVGVMAKPAVERMQE